MNPYFEFLGPADPGKQFEVPAEADELLIGRATECQLMIASSSVSRRHARLRRDQEDLWLEDLGSANGTFVNGDRLSAPHRLADQDRVAFGPVELKFTKPAPPEEAPIDAPTIALTPEAAATMVLPPQAARDAGAAPGSVQPTPATVVVPRPAGTVEEPTPATRVVAPPVTVESPAQTRAVAAPPAEPPRAVRAVAAAPASAGRPEDTAPPERALPAARPPSALELIAIAAGSFAVVFGTGLAIAYYF